MLTPAAAPELLSRRSGGDWDLRFGAFLRRTSLPAQVQSAIDQPDVAVGLWKISQHAPCCRIELFGQQADVIAAREQTIEQRPCFRVTALQNVVVDEPEAACEERAFSGRQPIIDIVCFITQHELVIDQEPVFDRSKRALYPRIGRGQKADQRHQQETGVELFGAVGLHEAVELAIEAALTDFGVNFIGKSAAAPGLFV